MPRRLKCPKCGAVARIDNVVAIRPNELVVRLARCTNIECRARMKAVETTTLSGRVAPLHVVARRK